MRGWYGKKTIKYKRKEADDKVRMSEVDVAKLERGRSRWGVENGIWGLYAMSQRLTVSVGQWCTAGRGKGRSVVREAQKYLGSNSA